MPPPIIVKSFRGKTQAKAAQVFQADAAHAALDGYRPISQSWAEGRRTGAAALCVALGVVLLIGGLFFYFPLLAFAVIFLVVGILSGTSDGALTVTYQRPDREPVVPPAPAPNHLGALESLTAMRDRGLISPEDFETKKAELLARL